MRVDKQQNQQATLAGEVTSKTKSAFYQKRALLFKKMIAQDINFKLGDFLMSNFSAPQRK